MKPGRVTHNKVDVGHAFSSQLATTLVRSGNRGVRPVFFPEVRMAAQYARAVSRSAQVQVRNNVPYVSQLEIRLSPEAVLNNYLIENFEAYLWRKESPGGALRNLANTDKVKSVWNGVWKQIPPDQRARYDSYYRELVAELSSSAGWDWTKKTKQQILAHVRDANAFVERLALPEASPHDRSETPVVRCASPPQVATAKMTAVASPVVQNEEKKSLAATKPQVRSETMSKAKEKALSNFLMKKFEEFLWGSGSLVGTLQSLAMTDNKIQLVWDEAVQQIPPGLQECYASYHSMIVFELSRSAWWEFFSGTRKTKQQILAKVGEANIFVEGLAFPEASTHGRSEAREDALLDSMPQRSLPGPQPRDRVPHN